MGHIPKSGFSRKSYVVTSYKARGREGLLIRSVHITTKTWRGTKKGRSEVCIFRYLASHCYEGGPLAALERELAIRLRGFGELTSIGSYTPHLDIPSLRLYILYLAIHDFSCICLIIYTPHIFSSLSVSCYDMQSLPRCVQSLKSLDSDSAKLLWILNIGIII